MQTAQLRVVIDARRFGDLLGEAEDIDLEAKEEPYDLESAAGRYELAKDVSAIANSGGGYLLIGIATRRELRHQRDVLDRLALLPADRFNEERYRGIIREYVYPAIHELNVSWSQCDGSAEGIAVICVPPQPVDRLPFIIAKLVESGEHLRQLVVGYAERVIAGNEPLSPKRIQEILRKGRDGTSQRLTRIEERLDQVVASRSTAKPTTRQLGEDGSPSPRTTAAFNWELLDDRIAGTLQNLDLPVYVIAATVSSGNRVREFYSTRPNSARELLRNAGKLRHAGFDIGINSPGEPAPDGSLDALQGERKRLRLFQDGTLIFRALADDSFLGWGAHDTAAFEAHPRLNLVPAVEIHASFANFYLNVLERLVERPTQVMFELVLRNHSLRGGRRLFLTETRPGDTWEWIDRQQYPVEVEPPEATLVVTAEALRNDPFAVAYQLVERFASLFDFPTELLPFLTETAGRTRVDVAALERS